jgi:ABC-2 type transport system permease protein
MSRFRPYIRVLRQQMLNALAKLMAFRTSFILSILVDIASAATFYISVEFLFLHMDRIGPWQREHFLFLSFWVQVLLNLHFIFASENFWNFSSELQTGNLDFRLLRPLGSMFDTFTAKIRPSSLLVSPFLIGLLIFYGMQVGLSGVAWILLVPMILLSLSLMILVEMTVAMTMFWTNHGDGINFLRMQFQQLQRWPDFLYPTGMRRTFTYVVPVLMTSSFACRFLFDPTDWTPVALMMVAVAVFWFVAGALWRLGLRRYESASS